jgi:hypothetical protein
MRPAHVQAQLAAWYELDLPLDVEAVLISDPGLRDALLPAGARRPPEQLLVRQDGDVLELALFLEPEVLDTLRRHDPRLHLGEANLARLAQMVEGVSHFVCVSWNGQHDRQVSALELELQGEIDTFLACAALAGAGAGSGGRILARLFDRVGFAADLDAEESARYRTAHRLAARYCLDLLRRYGDQLGQPAVRRELCRFYRLDRPGKFAAIG